MRQLSRPLFLFEPQLGPLESPGFEQLTASDLLPEEGLKLGRT